MKQNNVTFWIEEVDLRSLQFKLWERKNDILGQEKLILGHIEASYGTNNVNFWDRRSQFWVIMRQIMGQNELTFLVRSS
jgi:hypothetical protein